MAGAQARTMQSSYRSVSPAALSAMRSRGSTLRHPRIEVRKPWMQATRARASAPHYRHRLDNGSRPQPPSSRFHGFDRRDSDRLVDVSRTGVDSFVFSHRIWFAPLARGSYRTGGSQIKTAHHRHTLAAQPVCTTATVRDHQNCASCRRDADDLILPKPTTQTR
jgi:hypothetical protein